MYIPLQGQEGSRLRQNQGRSCETLDRVCSGAGLRRAVTGSLRKTSESATEMERGGAGSGQQSETTKLKSSWAEAGDRVRQVPVLGLDASDTPGDRTPATGPKTQTGSRLIPAAAWDARPFDTHITPRGGRGVHGFQKLQKRLTYFKRLCTLLGQMGLFSLLTSCTPSQCWRAGMERKVSWRVSEGAARPGEQGMLPPPGRRTCISEGRPLLHTGQYAAHSAASSLVLRRHHEDGWSEVPATSRQYP